MRPIRLSATAALLATLILSLPARGDRTPADLAREQFERANVLYRQGDFAGAIAFYSRAIAADPRLREAYNNRALARQASGDAEGALADLSGAVAIFPRYLAAWHNRGLLRKERGDFPGAIADLGRAIGVDPRHAESWFHRGEVYLLLGQSSLALHDLRRARSLAGPRLRPEVERLLRQARLDLDRVRVK